MVTFVSAWISSSSGFYSLLAFFAMIGLIDSFISVSKVKLKSSLVLTRLNFAILYNAYLASLNLPLL
jgi:hypothetical protein